MNNARNAHKITVYLVSGGTVFAMSANKDTPNIKMAALSVLLKFVLSVITSNAKNALMAMELAVRLKIVMSAKALIVCNAMDHLQYAEDAFKEKNLMNKESVSLV